MKNEAKILAELARLYELSQAGRTGIAKRDLVVDYENFLAQSGCKDGARRATAERELQEADRTGVLSLVRHRRDRRLIQQIRFSNTKEEALFNQLNRPSPTQLRKNLARQFIVAKQKSVPAEWRESWSSYCSRLESAALQGAPVTPFSRDSTADNQELLELIPKLLTWQGESLIRFASCVLCGRSKRLAELSGRIGQILSSLSDGKITSLEALGIVANPHFALVHGPLRLYLDSGNADFGVLHGPFRLAEKDILRANAIQVAAERCLTIENETTFHELAKLNSGELLIQTSFPGSATLSLLTRLPAVIELWHFGDTDPEGFDILRDLRERTKRPIQSLHMRYRPHESSQPLTPADRATMGRLLQSPLMEAEQNDLQVMLDTGTLGHYEQESLGRPHYRKWPFYRI